MAAICRRSFPIHFLEGKLWYFGTHSFDVYVYVDGLVQERRNSIANALDLRLSYTNPSICSIHSMPGSVQVMAWFRVGGKPLPQLYMQTKSRLQ